MLKTKIRKLYSFQRLSAFVGLVGLIVASMNYQILAQAVTQGFGSEQTLQRGMLVRLKENDATKVEAVKQESADKVYGVVVDSNDAPVTLSAEGKKVFIATNGHYEVLVSTQNGEVKAGDYLTISAIDGIGMKASDKEPIVAGRALADFDGKAGAISSAQVKKSDGSSQTINIGRVQADLSIARNPNLKGAEANLPEALRRAAEAIAGKPVNAVRVYVALFVFMVSTIVASVLLYGGVRSAIISIGRNPLGKKSIMRGMFQVVITGMTVFITGVFGVYLLLKI